MFGKSRGQRDRTPTRYCSCMESEPQTERLLCERIRGYGARATVLRQIQSNKGERAQRWSRRYVIATVVIAAIVSMIGFMGVDRLHSTVSRLVALPEGLLENIYNLAVLAILILTILGLLFRFEERGARHYRSIEVLTEFIRDVEDVVALAEVGALRLGVVDLDRVRLRYKGILATLPPNTDREHRAAKKNAQEKRANDELGASGDGFGDVHWRDSGARSRVEPALGAELASLLMEPPRMRVLAAVRDTLGDEAWVTGGFVREAVWDRLHGYIMPTQLDDVDVVFFDALNAAESRERALETALAAAGGNVRWSVKNQARMHLVTDTEPYQSLEDAVGRFPETATSVACRVGADGRICILAPYGLADLFALKVRPTPGFSLSRYRARIAEKRWGQKWPRLQIESGECRIDNGG